jgi:hypothetical protein
MASKRFWPMKNGAYAILFGQEIHTLRNAPRHNGFDRTQ